MIADRFNTAPVELLLERHRNRISPYVQEFRGLDLTILTDVFNPAFTKVSGFLADNLLIPSDSLVLDMFCGSGALSFLAARNAKLVKGVDISPQSIKCANLNANKLSLTEKTRFETANLWDGVHKDDRFDVIIANPPLLPAEPENWLEMAVADSPTMATTTSFIRGCGTHLTDTGYVLMSFSNACKTYFDSPLDFVSDIAASAGLQMSIKNEWDVGYEIYRILEFKGRDKCRK